MVNHRQLRLCEQKGHKQDVQSTWLNNCVILARCIHCDAIFDVRQNTENIKIYDSINHHDFEEELDEDTTPYWARRGVVKSTVSVFAFVLLLFPTISFADSDVFTVTEDAYIGAAANDWDTAHDATIATGGYFSRTDTSNYLQSGHVNPGDTNYLIRGYSCFSSTADIPDDATVTNVSLFVYVTSKSNTDNDGDDYFMVNGATPASTTTLASDDYEEFETVAFNTPVDFGSISTSAWLEVPFNVDGENYINVSGTTCIVTREGHDFEDVAILDNTDNTIAYRSGNYADSDFHPYLAISWDPAEEEPPETGSGGGIISPGCISGSGCVLGSSGALLITSSLCSDFEEYDTGSGSQLFCNQWDTVIEIPFILFVVRVVFFSVISGIVLYFILWILIKFITYCVYSLWCKYFPSKHD